MLELLAAAWLFWVMVGLFGLLALIGLETESYGWLVFVSICFLAIFGWKITLLHLTWKILVQGIGVYLVAGGVWSIYKWWRHVRKVVADYKEHNISAHSVDSLLSPGSNKAKITAWITYWPLSVFWALTHDIWTQCFKALRAIYEKISEKAHADIRAFETGASRR